MGALLELEGLRLEAGERLAVVGGAGSGKSALLRRLAAAAGARCSPRERLQVVARIPADPQAMLSGVTPSVRHEVAWTLENLGLAPAEMARRADAALLAVGLAALRDRSPWELSGGQQQRLALACGLAVEPRLLLLDEPGALLDPEGIEQLAELVQGCSGAVVWATARCEEVGWCPRWLVLDHGFREGAPGSPAGRALAPTWVRMGKASEAELIEALRETEAPRARPTLAPAGGVLAELRGVSCGEALRDVSLTIREGESVALLGGNGTGKTTLALALKGLLVPTAGQVLLGGEDAAHLSAGLLASRAAYLFQDPRAQVFCSTVREEVAFGPTQLGWPADRVARAVERALEVTEVLVDPALHPLDLPAGELRWVALASVLAQEAPLAILDEPSAALDGPGRERLERVLTRLRESGLACVLITHDLELAADHCSRAVVLEAGQVWADGPFGEVFGGEEPPPALRFPLAGRVARALGWPGWVCSFA